MCAAYVPFFLGSSKRRKLIEIAEFLETLLVQLNISIIEELIICESCIIKVQSACKFKTCYQENSCIKQEDIEDETVCEICKENINPTDCIPLLFSVTESDKLNLLKFLSSELQPKSQDSPQTCELCHNSILNFCRVIESVSAFAQNKISNETVTDLELIKSNSGQVINVNRIESTNESMMDIKEEKEDQLLITTYEHFLCKNEVDLKMEDELSSNKQDPEKSSTLQCPGNLTVDRNNSYLTAGIVNIKMDYNEYGNADNEKNNYENFDDNFDEVEMKYRNCDFQNNHTNDLYRHAAIHKNLNDLDKLQYQNWEFQTKNDRYLQNHVFIHKNNHDKMFICPNCKFQTKHKGNLKQHMLIHKDTNEVEMVKCQHCQFQTKRKGTFKQHMIIHKDTNEVEMFTCQLCQFQTKHKYYLKQHVLIHHKLEKVDMFKCQHCQFQTKYKYYLKKHILIHNNPEKMFKCQHCQFQTQFPVALNRHVTQDHYIEVEIFKCQHCWYQTKCNDDLKEHMLIHNKPKIVEFFQCENCQYQTKCKGNFKRHMLIHKGTTV